MTEYLFKMTDIVIVAENKELYFYKNVLCSTSNYFKALFIHNKNGSNLECNKCSKNKIVLDDKFNDVKELLKLIHPIQNEKVAYGNVYKIFKLVNKYEFVDLIQKCLNILENIHGHFNKIEELIEEILYLDECIKEYVTDEELCKRLKKIINNPINSIINSTNFDLKEEYISRLPPYILIKIMGELYKLNKAKHETNVKNANETNCLNNIKSSYVAPYINSQNSQISTGQLIQIFRNHNIPI